jgi:hypothetical protein
MPPTTSTHVLLGAGERVLAAAIACCCFAVLIIAWRLAPDGQGIGTHRQLGLPPCGWMVSFGRPCITCGMTTAFSHMAHAHPVESFKVQPMGAVLALLACVGGWIAALGAATGARVDRIAITFLRPRWLWPMAAGVLAAWAYKIVVTPLPTL